MISFDVQTNDFLKLTIKVYHFKNGKSCSKYIKLIAENIDCDLKNYHVDEEKHIIQISEIDKIHKALVISFFSFKDHIDRGNYYNTMNIVQSVINILPCHWTGCISERKALKIYNGWVEKIQKENLKNIQFRN